MLLLHPPRIAASPLREGQDPSGFPERLYFLPGQTKITLENVGRLIGNAVPPVFGSSSGAVFSLDLRFHYHMFIAFDAKALRSGMEFRYSVVNSSRHVM